MRKLYRISVDERTHEVHKALYSNIIRADKDNNYIQEDGLVSPKKVIDKMVAFYDTSLNKYYIFCFESDIGNATKKLLKIVSMEMVVKKLRDEIIQLKNGDL